ncbi:AI-2E family transporter [Nocardioides insulae]|uniref:AI-2E family transporter n=1 Tax=Nocardioides insulae TaxID=394734 RepID=UPI0003FA42DD|nr:AI-2E family transporter [Nocardioides insulae]
MSPEEPTDRPDQQPEESARAEPPAPEQEVPAEQPEHLDQDEPGEDVVPGAEPDEADEPLRRLPRIRRRRGATAEDMESFASRLFAQWNQLREERQEQLAAPVAPSTAVRRAELPWGVDLAAQWAWRFLVIAAAGLVLAYAVGYLSLVVVPVVLAVLISALGTPVVQLLQRIGLPRAISSLLVVIGGLALVVALLVFAGSQVANGSQDLADSTVQGLGQIREWLKNGPLQASESQINGYLEDIQGAIREWSAQGDIVGQVTEVGTALTHVVAGLFITIFAVYFFLADGARIWAWLVRLAPRAARPRMDSSGQVAWLSLTQYVRATIVVALVDSVGIMLVAAVLQVPFVAAIGVLVFLGAFVPMVGATVAGAVAVLVALVDQGLLVAVLMLAGVLGVQFVESHGLQPFLMGRWVSVHPLAIILAIAAGSMIAGIAGALVAVPTVAALNAVVTHLSAQAESVERAVPEPAGAGGPGGPRAPGAPGSSGVRDDPREGDPHE